MVKRLFSLAEPGSESRKVLEYIDECEAFTYDIIENVCGVTHDTVVRTTRILRVHGSVVEAGRVNPGGDGRPPKIFLKAGAHPSRVAEAHKTHLELKSKPKSEMDDNLRQLVSPIVDDVIGYVFGMHRDSSYGLPLKEVRRRYREAHGVFTEDVESAVFKVAKEKGWTLLVEV